MSASRLAKVHMAGTRSESWLRRWIILAAVVVLAGLLVGGRWLAIATETLLVDRGLSPDASGHDRDADRRRLHLHRRDRASLRSRRRDRPFAAHAAGGAHCPCRLWRDRLGAGTGLRRGPPRARAAPRSPPCQGGAAPGVQPPWRPPRPKRSGTRPADRASCGIRLAAMDHAASLLGDRAVDQPARKHALWAAGAALR